MTTIMKRFTKGVVLKGESTDVTENAEGSLFQNSAELRLKAYIEGAVRQIVTNTQSQVLTNKTIDADNNSVSNIQTSSLKAGVLNTDTSLTGASNTQLPSALAVKTYVDTKAAAQNEASEISFTPAGTIAATTVQAMGQELDGDIQAHITDTTDAHAASAITNTPSGNLAATTVQGALDELQSDVDTRATTTALTNHTTASANVHGLAVGSSVVGTTDSQVLTNKTITGADIRTPIRSDVKQDTKANLTTYALTAANGQLVFATDTKEMFQVVDATLKAVGGGGGVSDVDSLLIQPFDTSALTDFTQTGLELIETNPLDGTKSARLIHQAASTRSFKQTVAVPPKFRGVNMTASLTIRSSASQGNVTIVFRDETNSIDYPSQQLQTNSQAIASLVTNSTITVSGFSNSNINTLKVGMTVTGSGIPTGTTIASINTTALTITLSQAATASATVSLRFSDLPRTLQLGFNIPANCSSYSYTISALQESGSPETYIDDVVLKNYWLGMSNQGQSTLSVQVPIETDWQTATFSTLAWQGLGTVTSNLKCKRDGGDLLISGTFVTGTTSGSQFQIPLPTWNGSQLTSASSSRITSGQSGGTLFRGAASEGIFANIILEPSVTVFYSSLTVATATANNPLTKGNGSSIFSNGETGTLTNVRIPIEGWAVTETQSFVTTDLVPAKAVFGNSSIDVPNMTAWQGYTPTFQGFGTPSAVEFEWRQVGENVEVRGKFVSGTSTAVEARVSLPAGLTSAGTGLIPSIQVIGQVAKSATDAGLQALIEPSVTYVTFGFQNASASGLTKQNANIVVSSGQSFSFTASVPCAGLSALSTKTIALTQSGLVQNADSLIRLSGPNGYGSTNTKIQRFTTIQQNIGSDIIYADSATLGASFTINTAGIYDINFSYDAATQITHGISVNSNQLTTNIQSISAANILSYTANLGGLSGTCSYSGYFNVGDVIRCHGSGGAVATIYNFSIARQGYLKQIAVSSDQKITIPTSELRFEGASTRGSTATAIVRFDSIAKIRGDAFSVVSDATNGTAITMLKAGRLSVSATTFFGAVLTHYISRNQQVLTASPSQAEKLTASAWGDGNASSSWTGDVNIGDIIRISSLGNPTNADASNSLNLAFQEQEIAVSVTNTLPQFSDSDSSVRVDTANGYGSTATRIRRFSNIRDNIGTDIEYVDSATNGASFTVKSAGIYNISYSDNFSTAGRFGLSKNTSSLGSDINAITTSERLAIEFATGTAQDASVSWQGYLNAGDVIRAHTDAATSSDTLRTTFSISKVGKPNVTGVDVTPFVNVPQPESQVITFNRASVSSANLSSVSRNTNNGILSISSTGVITTLKRCRVVVSGSNLSANLTNRVTVNILIDGVSQATGTNDTANNNTGSTASYTTQLEAGQTVQIQINGPSDLATGSITAEATSDQILTAPDTFSTDTAALQYASSAAYTLSTLSSAPVGTYITFTYAANTNTRTQTTTRPTQTDADMNANGLLVYTRAYNAASTAAQPAAIAIQIGKGLKGKSLDLYKSAGKVTSGSLDLWGASSTTFTTGAQFKDYDEKTGILYIDAGYQYTAANTSTSFLFSDLTTQASGYVVINSSRNPALTGFTLPRVYASYSTDSGQAVVDNNTIIFEDRIIDTHGAYNAGTGVYTCPEAGRYVMTGNIRANSVAMSADQVFGITARNLTSGEIKTSSRFVCQFTRTTSPEAMSYAELQCNVGDQLVFRFDESLPAVNLLAGGNQNFMTIRKVGN